ncbi:MAG: ATP-dependent RNA helicase HrpA [Rhodoferax sp.]
MAEGLRITFPEDLPVSARRDEIMAALAAHPVLIVCGETGSGKTTQLPKMALALGRAGGAALATRSPDEAEDAHPRRARRPLIGHTQPRRIAASSVAARIAHELDTPLGEVVGYKVRFQDRLSPGASVKLMTDGILLAETQTDPLLRAYDTLIIDEAHERSLNIDFLLGYLKQILPQRPDLKLIVTSATIDADRFARHFASAQGPAPVLTVSGRTYPVEVRWRPFEESRDYGLNEAIADAVDELWATPTQVGDVLVFLPGEREIREAADHLRGHLSHSPVLRGAEVLPLFARLSPAEQDRVFAPHSAPRIVLATNVAETSLTVPGIRYVIDSGTARVKRYSLRSKVEQLLVEPISQAAANQRAGRCGRVAAGVCIRLYDEADFAARPAFTDPEILRASLAGVILRMKALRLGAVEDFPFLERPSGRAIADGYQQLQELGALDDQQALTPLGHELARLPLDPRLGRMILEARNRQALSEVLVIAAALSVQDVRDRPLDAQAQADQAHAPFDDDKSEFLGCLRLWHAVNHAALPDPRVTLPAPQVGSLPPLKRKQEQWLRQHFINVRRVREWRDTYVQLHTVVAEHRWHLNTSAASYEALHLSLLSGLLGNVGFKLDAEAGQPGSGEYLGARGIKFYPHPGAHLRKKPGRWVVAAELVETSRLYGRGLANIEPQWLEQVGAHLLKKQVLDPHWEKKTAQVIAFERATLYGLVVYSGRRTAYSRVDAAAAREIFIRAALVENDWDSRLPFLTANRKLIAQVQELEHKARRQDVLVDDELIFAFYDSQIPAEVCSGADFEAWYRQAARLNPHLLMLTREELMRHEAASITNQAFPKILRLGGVDCSASYLHDPGDARDGLSVTVPLFALNQIDEARCDWLVPGMLQEKVLALLKTLPQRPRSRLVPLPQTAQRMAQQLSEPAVFGHGLLIDALLKLVRQATGLDVARTDFKPDQLAPHHRMLLRVVDENGRQLGSARNLAALKTELGARARGAFQALAGLKLAANAPSGPTSVPKNSDKNRPPARTEQAAKAPQSIANSAPTEARYTAWTFGELPELLEIRKGNQTLIGYPALIDGGDAVTLEVFDQPELAAAHHRVGLRRLAALQVRDALKHLEKSLPGLQSMAVAYMQVGRGPDGKGPGGTLEGLRQQILELALDRAFVQDPLPTDAAGFAQRIDEGRSRLGLIAQEVARHAAAVLNEYTQAARKLRDYKGHPAVAQDVAQQLARLVPKDFLHCTPWSALQHLPRYLKAIGLRLDKLRNDPQRDAQHMRTLQPLEQRYWRRLAERKGVADARLDAYRWLLEELRVSLFAQELRTPQPVSAKRLEKAWAQLDD